MEKIPDGGVDIPMTTSGRSGMGEGLVALMNVEPFCVAVKKMHYSHGLSTYIKLPGELVHDEMCLFKIIHLRGAQRR